jgi:hypothetical protein
VLPPTIEVKISSEQAGSIAITPVVAQQMSAAELMGTVLAAVGKDRPRILEVLRRGTAVVGGTRFRWQRIELSEEELEPLLAVFPDSNPSRAFDGARCREMRLQGPGATVVITREAGSKKRWFRRASLWDELLRVVGQPVYGTYSYKDQADLYVTHLNGEMASQVRAASALAAFSSLEQQVARASVQRIECVVAR